MTLDRRADVDRRAGRLRHPFVPISRGYFESARWLGARPFHPEMAWLDVIFLARVTDGPCPRTGLDLSRGEFAASYPWLASRWGWTLMKVRRWVEQRIASREFVVSQICDPRQGVPTVYLLVNYDTWNGGEMASDTPTPLPTPPTDRGGDQLDMSMEQRVTGSGKSGVTGGSDTPTDTPIERACNPRKNAFKNVGDEEMTPTFQEAWSIYPKRPNNSRVAAWRQWKARVKAGVQESEMLAGTKVYKAHCQTEGKEGTEFVKMAQTFYGRDLHFRAALESAAPSAGDEELIDLYRPDSGDLTPAAARLLGLRQ